MIFFGRFEPFLRSEAKQSHGFMGAVSGLRPPRNDLTMLFLRKSEELISRGVPVNNALGTEIQEAEPGPGPQGEWGLEGSDQPGSGD